MPQYAENVVFTVSVFIYILAIIVYILTDNRWKWAVFLQVEKYNNVYTIELLLNFFSIAMLNYVVLIFCICIGTYIFEYTIDKKKKWYNKFLFSTGYSLSLSQSLSISFISRY